MPSTTDLRNLRNPVVVAAFGGWNDAGEAASGVIDHLSDLTRAEFIFALDPDDFYDFTQNRPVVTTTATGERINQWPTVEVLVGHLPERDLVLIGGPEPNFHWREFCSRLVSAMRTVQPEKVVMLGAMLTDAPHRRPVFVSQDGTDYEGPTGIVGVLTQSCRDAGLETTTLWASVPHYVTEPPNPKATLALLGRVEDVLDTVLDVKDLPQEAAEWEERVNDLASDDPDVASYISSLEEHYDQAAEGAEPGDVIAAEFERYLRRRNR
ncbi:PAC2 family protein [Nigerium massiliense]|uniref:PAC2 family protein n=1 Tax=Nigerium massiliense TaxID=1522317 RepID=UPI00058DF666|nr:PAC2 family protein [Nigerium massiliense]